MQTVNCRYYVLKRCDNVNIDFLWCHYSVNDVSRGRCTGYVRRISEFEMIVKEAAKKYKQNKFKKAIKRAARKYNEM